MLFPTQLLFSPLPQWQPRSFKCSPGDVCGAVADGVWALRGLRLRLCPGQGLPPVHTSLQRLPTHWEENCDSGILPGWPKQRTNGGGNTQSKILGVFCHLFLQFAACANASVSSCLWNRCGVIILAQGSLELISSQHLWVEILNRLLQQMLRMLLRIYISRVENTKQRFSFTKRMSPLSHVS